jgi:hypothetical protein
MRHPAQLRRRHHLLKCQADGGTEPIYTGGTNRLSHFCEITRSWESPKHFLSRDRSTISKTFQSCDSAALIPAANEPEASGAALRREQIFKSGKQETLSHFRFEGSLRLAAFPSISESRFLDSYFQISSWWIEDCFGDFVGKDRDRAVAISLTPHFSEVFACVVPDQTV